MENELLIDSNVFIKLLRMSKDPALILNEWSGYRVLATCGIIRLEVLRGVKMIKKRNALIKFMNVMVNIPSDNRLWEKALEIAWNQERIGKPIPNADAVVAASAMRIHATVVTLDKHFLGIDDLRVIEPAPEWFL